MSTSKFFKFTQSADPESEDWLKRKWAMPGSPYIKAKTLLGQGTEKKKEQTLQHFLSLPIAKYVDNETRRQCALLGFPWPDNFPSLNTDEK